MSLAEIDAAARAASRQRSSAMFINVTIGLCQRYDVPATAFHKILEEDYGRVFLELREWSIA